MRVLPEEELPPVYARVRRVTVKAFFINLH